MDPERFVRGTPRAERRRDGKGRRRTCPRSAHARWTPPRDRGDVVELLRRVDRPRLPELLPIRYGRMASNAFAFFRGSAPVMARDLAGTPATGLRVQMAGDAHVGNFGVFGTPERDLVFDANDFDETLPGPWEWDLKRLLTSLVLVGRSNDLPVGAIRRAARAAVRAYGERIGAFAAAPYLETWYAHLDLAFVRKIAERPGAKLFEAQLDRARERTGFHTFPRLARSGRAGPRVRDRPPLLAHYRRAAEAAAMRELFARYVRTLPPERRALLERYRLVDVARKVVGVGSVGTRCAVGLFLGDPDVLDPLLLQVKEALPSAHEPYLAPSEFANHADRVVTGQRLLQQASDLLLGWDSVGGRDYYVRQLRDMKFSSDIMALAPRTAVGLAELAGAALAHGHARTGDPAALAGYLGRGRAMEEALSRFAVEYARQVERDFATFRAAVRSGALPVAAPT